MPKPADLRYDDDVAEDAAALRASNAIVDVVRWEGP